MAKWKVQKSRWVGMSLPWLVLDERGEMVATFSTQAKALAYARSKAPRVQTFTLKWLDESFPLERIIFTDGQPHLVPKGEVNEC